MFPLWSWLPDVTLLLLRLMLAIVFGSSGWSHLMHPEERGKSIGMSTGFTRFLGLAELAGSLGVAFGVFPQLAALGLILVMLGAKSFPLPKQMAQHRRLSPRQQELRFSHSPRFAGGKDDDARTNGFH